MYWKQIVTREAFKFIPVVKKTKNFIQKITTRIPLDMAMVINLLDHSHITKNGKIQFFN